MTRNDAVNRYNWLMSEAVGSTNDEPVSKWMPFGYMAIGAMLPMYLSIYNHEEPKRNREKVAEWLREWADALTKEDQP